MAHRTRSDRWLRRLRWPRSPASARSQRDRPTVAGSSAVLCAWALSTAAAAQTPSAPVAQLAPVSVTGRAEPTAGIGGWGDVPLARTPIQASVFGTERLKDAGAGRLADAARLDPGVSDAYNTEGYWDSLTVRGFVLDNRYNFRRDGLPISAETSIPLDNKSRIEILKGASGIQAGTSAPGGLVNYVVKRPLDAPLRAASIEWREAGSVTGTVDLSQRFGVADAFGLRLNAAAAHLDPKVRSASGDRRLVALAGDWRLGPDTLLEAEIESSHRSQPSVPGFSLLGNAVPAPVDPRINLNNQPWSLPVVLEGTTSSLRWRQRLADDWRLTAHAATQRLRSDDRIAFPSGCTDAEPAPDGTYYPDRYCPDGRFDLYDFRSDGERRRTDAVDVALAGRLATGPVAHDLTVGVQWSRRRDRFGPQVFNYVGTGRVDGRATTEADPTPAGDDTLRSERSTEFYLRDAAALTARLTAWLGLRHTRLARGGSASFTTPWVAVSYTLGEGALVYASWGRGVESEVVPNLPRYGDARALLPAIESRADRDRHQGRRRAHPVGAGGLRHRPTADRRRRHLRRRRQLRARARRHATPPRRRSQRFMASRRLDLERRRPVAARAPRRQPDDAIDGREPTNVPARTLRLQTDYDVAALPGLALQARLASESARQVLPDNSARIAGYGRVDAAARYDVRHGTTRWRWRVGIDNLLDRRAWRESPYQFGHAYLFPLPPRTLRIGAEVEL